MSWLRRAWLPGLVGLALWVISSPARAQGSCTFTDENGKTVTWPNCEDPNEKPAPTKAPAAATPGGAAKSFPFPGETPATPAAANPEAPPAALTTTGGTATTGPQQTSKRFPFPGEASGTSSIPAPGLQDAGSSGTSSSDSGTGSSSSSSSSSSDGGSGEGPLADDDDPAAAAAAARKARKRLPKADTQTPNEREQEDLSVAAFYQNDANYKGAYERAKDAVSIAADDPDAHFALAEAARKLGKLDEAETHYKKCLTLDPVPKERKAAEKALKEMSGG